MTILYLALVATLAAASAMAKGIDPDPYESVVCEPVKSDLCTTSTTSFYNMTAMPNFANHKKQEDAIGDLKTYIPLIETKCSEWLQFFLCAVYIPVCAPMSNHHTGQHQIIRPCRPLCQEVKSDCEATLKTKFGYDWPEVLDCQRFPETNIHEHMCMNPMQEWDTGAADLEVPVSSLNDLQTNTFFMKKVKEHVSSGDLNHDENLKSYVNLIHNFNFENEPPAQGTNPKCGHLKQSARYLYVEREDRCIPHCGSEVSFNNEAKEWTTSFILGLSVVCLFFSASTVLVLTINWWGDASNSSSITRLASSTAMYLALSYVGLSFGHMLGEVGKMVNCGRDGLPCEEWLCVRENEKLILAQEGHRSQPCVVIFLFVYFFMMAASAWWTVVAFTWCLAQRWTTSQQQKSRVANVSSMCHLYGWGLPATLTVIAVVLHLVEADELTSLCMPGGLQDDNSLLVFVIIPEGIQLVLGICFYLVGMCLAHFCGDATTSEAARGKNEAKAIRLLKKRVSFFGFLYLMLKVSVFCTWIVEYTQRRRWLSIDFSKEFADPALVWIRVGFTLTCSILLPLWILPRETIRRCQNLSCVKFWTAEKDKPPLPSANPTSFPSVAYRPQATMDSDMIHIDPDQQALPGMRRPHYL